MEAVKGNSKILMSRKATSVKMNKITSRNLVLGSNLCRKVVPGKYLIRII